MRRAGLALSALVLSACVQAPPTQDTRRSGFDDMSPPLQAMQRDDTQNPGMLWVKDGEAAWHAAPSSAKPSSCASCHGDAAKSMRGVAARYPAMDDTLQRPINLQQRINHCRESRQGLPALALESAELLNLESYIAHQSRGLPLAPPSDARLKPWHERGAQLYAQRAGQLNLSCAQCHDERAGKRLAGSVIPQGHANGYPLYRLEWQSVGSLQRRLRNCAVGVRAEPFAHGSPEAVQLELYLAARSSGMLLEAPGVRP